LSALFFILKIKTLLFDEVFIHKIKIELIQFYMQKLKTIFPDYIGSSLKKLDKRKLQEIRLRAGKPVVVLYSAKKYFLSDDGLTLDKKKAFYIDEKQIENTLMSACHHSLHSFSRQLSQGYLSPFDGVRIGVCGHAVYNKNEIVSFKDIYSLNIRIPHQVEICTKELIEILLHPLSNILVMAPPGRGKTTFLRDLILQSSFLENPPNILLADERGEIAGCVEGKNSFDIGCFCDVITYADKIFAFSSGIRTMTPDVVVCDEICERDVVKIKEIAESGVKIFCSMHGKEIENIKSKDNFKIFSGIFDRYVFLSDKTIGKVEFVFDEKLECIYK